MKIIQQGKLPERPKNWWHGLQPTCSFCGTVVEVDTDDVPHSECGERHPEAKRIALFTCPFCAGQSLRCTQINSLPQ